MTSRRDGDPTGEVAGTGGIVVVDKPAGMTSHDVVARARKALRTRRIGHAGTLDPMATGVLVLGVGRATKLLGHLAGADKTYTATIRLGQATGTDDAEGDVVSAASAAGVGADALRATIASFVGDIEQVPSSVSAIKVDGRRAYARVRAGEPVQLAARRVHIGRIDVAAIRRVEDLLDVDVELDCSAGTYVRALARDVGARLGVGGHLTALRRTRVGSFDLMAAVTLETLAQQAESAVISLDDVTGRVFGRRDLDADEARVVANGGRLRMAGIDGAYGAYDTDGQVIALMTETDGAARPLVVLRPAR